MFIPSPRTPSSPTSTGVTTVILVQRSECVPKKRGSSPVVAIQWETAGRIAASWRPISIATAVEEEFARAFIDGCDIILDRLSRMETHPSSRG